MLESINNRLRADLDEISGRSNSLLTHISIMIAVISVFLFYSQSQAERGVIVMVLFAELVGYILTALACLGAIGLQPVVEFGEAANEREFYKLSRMSRGRSSLYTLSYFSALVLTALFLGTLLVDLDVVGMAMRLLSTTPASQ